MTTDLTLQNKEMKKMKQLLNMMEESVAFMIEAVIYIFALGVVTCAILVIPAYMILHGWFACGFVYVVIVYSGLHNYCTRR